MKSKTVFTLYLLSGLLTVIVAIVGLWVNIRIVPLNEDIQRLSQSTEKLLQENESLRIELQSTLSLHELDRLATELLKMAPPKKIHYLEVKRKAKGPHE